MENSAKNCFNPCYVGLWSVRTTDSSIETIYGSFNPCYVGLWSVRLRNAVKLLGGGYVSILVMLDYGL